MSFLRRRLTEPIKALLYQGAKPHQLAWALAVGATIGIFPIVGTTTLLCAGLAVILRLNLATIQIANYLVYPLQLALVFPFVRAGERLLGAEPLPLSATQLGALIETEGWRALGQLGWTGLHAATAWALLAPVFLGACVLVLRPVLDRAAAAWRPASGPKD